MTTEAWSPAEIQRALGQLEPATCAKGLGYANRRMIIDYAVLSTHITGRCRGRGRAEYECTISWEEFGDDTYLEADCTCPVRIDCKHCAALLITVQREKPTVIDAPPGVTITGTPDTWRTLLTELQQIDAAPAGPTEELPVALLFAVSQEYGATSITIQPMRPGKSKPWIMTGLTWSNVFGLPTSDAFSPTALRALRAVAKAADPMPMYRYNAPRTIRLTGSPDVWEQLADAREAGVTFLGRRLREKGLCDVEIVDLIDAHLSVERTVDGAHISLGLFHDGARIEPGDIIPLSRETDAVACVLEGGLVIGPLPELTATEKEMLRTGGVLAVPESALGELSAALPRLTGGREIEIADDGFEAQVIDGPVMVLVIRHHADGAHTSWQMAYTVNDVPHRYDPMDLATDPYLRDLPAEDRLLTQNRIELEMLALVCASWAAEASDVLQSVMYSSIRAGDAETVALFRDLLSLMRTAERETIVAEMPEAVLSIPMHLTLVDTALVCGDLVPLIRERGNVEVIIEGDEFDFRRPDAAPVIHFTGDAGTDWFNLTISLNIDGQMVPIADVIRALRAGDSIMVLPDGLYFPLDGPEIERLRDLLDEARALGEIEKDRVATGTFNVSLWEELLELGVVDQQLAAWQERIRRLAQARPPHPVAPPAGLRAQLREYQQDGFDWLSFLWENRLGGILADDMGLGKTMQTLALMGRILDEQPDARFLVVAPTSVVGNWALEAQRFLPDAQVSAVTATHKRVGLLTEIIGDTRIVVTSYTLLRIDYDNLAEIDWAAVVFDEAQFIKNHNSQTHRAARRLPAELKLAITGTPMENRVMELWALVSVVAPGLFPSPKVFKEHFAAPIESGREPDRLDVLRRRLKPIMLRRTKAQVLDDLPDKQEQQLTLALDTKHRKVYDTFLARERQRMLGLLDDFDNNRIQILRALTAMRQLSLHPGLVDPQHADLKSSKITYLAEQIPELIAEGHSALVFSSFTGFLKLVADRFDADGIEYSYLDGSMSARKRAAQIENFTAGHTGVFLISLKAGGFGLNLTAADYCFVTDPWWNPAAENQAVDRAHRIGQKRAVTVYRMAAENTIEEKVIALQNRKRELFNALIDDGGQFSGAITAADVRSLLE